MGWAAKYAKSSIGVEHQSPGASRLAHRPSLDTMARILLVDDEAKIRRPVRRVLERAGHTVSEADDGMAALRLQTAQPFDLIITDIYMPDCDGIEFLIAVRRTSDVKVIVVSGGDSTGTTEMLRDAELLGAVRALPKPTGAKELLALVTEILANKVY
jgi:two-component system chemotaxis response regulator CheY